MPFEDALSTSLDPSRPIAPQLFAALRTSIVHGELTPGQRVSEAEIAATFAISRQPVREAFIRLAAEGLLDIRPQRSTTVSRINYADVLDTRFLREAIEADIVRLLAQAPDPDLIADLTSQIGIQRSTIRQNPDAFMQLDDQFHRTLAEGAGKGRAWRRIEGLKSQMDRARYLALTQFPAERLLTQHRLLVARIAKGDPDAAEAAIRDHLREVLTDLPVIARAAPEYFELPEGDLPDPVLVPIQGGAIE